MYLCGIPARAFACEKFKSTPGWPCRNLLYRKELDEKAWHRNGTQWQFRRELNLEWIKSNKSQKTWKGIKKLICLLLKFDSNSLAPGISKVCKLFFPTNLFLVLLVFNNASGCKVSSVVYSGKAYCQAMGICNWCKEPSILGILNVSMLRYLLVISGLQIFYLSYLIASDIFQIQFLILEEGLISIKAVANILKYVWKVQGFHKWVK